MVEKQSPVIIIGMHRSGTTMLSTILQSLGVFQGRWREKNNESILFLKYNNMLLQRVNSTWDLPEKFIEEIKDDKFCSSCASYIKKRFPFESKLLYWWVGNARPILWGWKDPRTTITLPVWLELFPNCRIINIYRHGVDVALSLVRREREAVSNQYVDFVRRTLRRPNQSSPRCSTLDGAFNLWELYTGLAEKHVKSLAHNAISICYESFLSNPQIELKRLLHFIGLSEVVNTEKFIKLVDGVRSDRAFAFMDSADGAAFFSKVENNEMLLRLGYSQ